MKCSAAFGSPRHRVPAHVATPIEMVLHSIFDQTTRKHRISDFGYELISWREKRMVARAISPFFF